ncbi:OmpA/MotB domain protein [Thiorhodococcus drewsii AZ1]|uniref:OmpA/MotB domain protein n=1 Tax=Thiorhodococcus drewsii AZ1 TaxID=765913 RepID=G2E7P1_9GAMM|nr:OmpA family protein [Thiorhodococcus drewsii]EGV27880.1 OmpA/MotB domain protein [Thiorhodococcus drewsii AZ1]
MRKTSVRFALAMGFVSAFTLAGCSSVPKNSPPPPAPVPTFTLEGVNFANDSDRLSASADSTLTQAADALKQMPEQPYEVAGYTDSNASDAYNQDLSERRAMRVRSRLIDLGVPGSQLTAKGYGESQPVADNATASGRAANRRVEIRPF